MSGDLFEFVPFATTSDSSSHECPSQNEIDVVYTWVNGSDLKLIDSITSTTNKMIIDDLCQKCSNKKSCNQDEYCLQLPAILIRPRLDNPRKHLPNILKFDYFNQSASLVYFSDSQAGIHMCTSR